MSKLQQRLRELINKSEWKELEDLLLNTEDEWVLEILERKLHGSDGPKWIGGMLTSLSCSTRESTALRLKIYEKALKHARIEVGNDRITGKIVGVLMVHVATFPPDALLNLVDQYLDFFKTGESIQGGWVSVLPKLVMTLSRNETLNVDGKQMSGEDYRYQVVKILCDLDWSAETATSLLPMFSDLDLPKEELQDVIHKLERVLKKVDYQSVPPIIYHLIDLSIKSPGCVIQIVLDYFNNQEKKLQQEKDSTSTNFNSLELDSEIIEDGKRKDLAEAQGTVILHVTHQAQSFQALVRDFLKVIKSSTWLPERVITPFNLSLSLSLASIEKYEDQILECLKSFILKHYRQEEKSRKSLWLREAWGETCHISTAFKATINNCIMGWDDVCQGLVKLGFKLLESGSGPKAESYVSQRAVALASVILCLLLKKQPHLGKEILSRISNFVLSASSPLQYIEILGKLVKHSPLVILDHLSIIQELLGDLTFLPLSAASHLLQALLPLFKMSMTLKDALMIILRKMMFSKKIENRQVAVRGFLQFLRHFRAMGTLPSSQASMSFSSSLSTVSISADVHSAFSNSTNEALCLELLGVLRRCFSQQHQVKSVLYIGLYDVCRANPRLIVSILELLHNQSKQFLDKRPVVFNPILLSKVVVVQGDSAVLVEPMGHLLSCLGACKYYLEKHRREGNREAEDDEEEEEREIGVLNDVCGFFDAIIEKLAGCGLDDIGLDEKGEYGSSTTVGEKNLATAKVMVSVYDSLMEYSFNHGAATSRDKMQTVISLFKSQKKIMDLVREKSVKPGKKEGAKKEGTKGKGRPTAKSSVSFKGNLRLSVVADMLMTSFGGEESSDPDCVDLLKGNHDLQMYLLSNVEETLSGIKGMIPSERERALPHLKTIAKVLLQECTENIVPDDSSDDRHINRLRQSLLILSSLITIFCKYFENKLEVILREVTRKNDTTDVNGLLYKVCKKCQKMLLKILNHDERSPLLKDACVILQIMSTVCQALDPGCDEILEVQSWMLQLCKDQEPENGSVAESMLSLLFFLSDQVKANHLVPRSVGRELHHRFGDLEEGVTVKEVNKFKIVTEATSSSVLLALLSYMDDSINLVELAINKLKACLASSEDCDADTVEKYICTKCTVYFQATFEIIHSALTPGAGTDSTMKFVTKFYNILSLYAKYYLELFKSKNYTQISEKFERLVHSSGEMLSAPIYSLITYIEDTDKQHIGKKSEGVLMTRTMKESKLIPSLIYAIEQYEKHLIDLSRKSKVNLMEGMKLSTSRDFRIVPAAITEALQNNNEDEEEEQEEESRRIEDDNSEVEDNHDSDAEGQDSASNSSQEGDGSVNSQENSKSNVSLLKKGTKRKEVSDENDANTQNKRSQLLSKKPKSLKT